MDPTTIQYVGFVVAALILIWAVIEINRRLYRRDKSLDEARNHWVELNTRQPDAREESPLAPSSTAGEEEDDVQIELHARARQNGHHAESQKPQI